MSRKAKYDPWDEDQLVIPVAEVKPIPRMKNATIDERFEALHGLNPWVFDALVRLAEDWRQRGRGAASMKMFVENLRWRHARQTIGDELKINNDYTSRYVRLLQDERPDLAHLFRTRKLLAA